MLTNRMTLVFLLALAVMSGCASKGSKKAGAQPENAAAESVDFPIIDAHIHTNFTGEPSSVSGIVRSKESLIAEMKANGVVGAVSMNFHDGDGWADLKEQNVIHCAGVDGVNYAARVEKGLKSGKYKCIKIYLGYVLKYATDPGYTAAYKLARKYKVPVVFHTGDLYPPKGKLKYAHPMAIDDVATDYSDVQFVIAHAGNPWVRTATEIAYKNPNVALEISAFLIGDLNEMPREKVDQYVVEEIRWAFGFLEDPSKMIYGTDWPLTKMDSYIDAVKRAIPKEHWRAVFHDNAARIFKFKR